MYRGKSPLAIRGGSATECQSAATIVQEQSRHAEAHGRQQKRRNLTHAHANRQERRAPHKINDGEG